MTDDEGRRVAMEAILAIEQNTCVKFWDKEVMKIGNQSFVIFDGGYYR